MKRWETFFTKWARGRFDSLGKKITKLRKERQRLMEMKGENISGHAIMEISRKIEHAVEMEAIHWKQRARVNWLANGDRNSRAFHIHASKRQKNDFIMGLRDDCGVWKEEEKDKALLIHKYFSDLFCSSKLSRVDMDRVVSTVEVRLG